MTRVDFYILPESAAEARLRFACRLAAKASRMGNRVLIASASADEGQQLSQLLWSLQPESFVAHDLPADKAQASPILVSWDGDWADHHDLLINLTATIPPNFSRFHRLAEIICQQPDLLALKREHFGFYRERGYPIQSHPIPAPQAPTPHD